MSPLPLYRCLVVALCLVSLVGCAAKRAEPRSVSGKIPQVSGEVVYRERMALPPSAVAQVTLLETVPGKESVAISTLRIETAGRSIPIPFTISLDGKLPPKASYALSASIDVNGTPFFRTPSPVPVDLGNAGQPVTLLTHRVMIDPTGPEPLLRRAPLRLEGVSPAPASERVTLRLEKDHVFHLRRVTATQSREQAGRWHQLADGRLQLAVQGQRPQVLLVENADVLLPERTGKQQTVLRLQPQPRDSEPLAPAGRAMTGIYRQQEGQATFRDCATQALFTVASGGDAAILREIYQSKARLAGEPLLARVEATPIVASAETEAGAQPRLTIDRYVQLAAGQCQPMDDTPPAILLGNARWQLIEAFGEPVRNAQDREPAHLVFEPSAPDRGAVFGSDGCNRFRGSYLLQGDTMSFSQMASTLMLCQELGDQPQTFHRALAETDGWRAMGHTLELTRQGRVLAVFEKAPL